LLTFNQLTGTTSGTGYICRGPVNHNCSHLQPPTSCLSTVDYYCLVSAAVHHRP